LCRRTPTRPQRPHACRASGGARIEHESRACEGGLVAVAKAWRFIQFASRDRLVQRRLVPGRTVAARSKRRAAIAGGGLEQTAAAKPEERIEARIDGVGRVA